MPMSPSAVVVGRSIANMIYSALSLAILLGCGLAIGWRWHGTVAEAAAAIGLLLLLRLAFLWVGIYLGLIAKSPEMANAVYGLLYPVTMLSNAFIAPELMPRWLGAVADWNPLSSTITATRRLFGNPGVERSGWLADHAVLMSIAWPVVITALTLPLAVRAYQRLSR
jgi:ABC-type multidrug transport system permease subunit